MKNTGELLLKAKQRPEKDEVAIQLIERCLGFVREDVRESPYIEEALRVLPVGGYRSAIGSFWNAVVDDLRNKIMARQTYREAETT